MVPTKRVRVAQGLALVALVAALVGALGPAERVRTTYSWPPRTLPERAPDRVWYTPLLLVEHRPETISARIPCTLAPPLRDANRPTTVLATARYPDRTDGLSVTQSGDQLLIGIGRQILDRVDLARTRSSECVYDLFLGAGQWSVRGGPGRLARRGTLEALPKVTGLFSALDLRSRTRLSINVTTTVHATRTTGRQKVAWTLAALSAVAALLLVAIERRPRPLSVTRRAVRAAASHVDPADGVVVAALLGWWVLSPSFFDDGYVFAREQMFASSGGFSTYYNAFGANLPLDYWHEWLHHWLAQATSALLLLRLPALFCLATIWVLCRWMLVRVGPSSARGDRIVLWSLVCAFLIGAMAWGMTLRPEPITALLVTAVAACTVRFLQRETTGSVAAGAVLVPLALTAHPAGIVSLAAVLVAAPRLVRSAGRRLPAAATLVLAATALLLVLGAIDSDLVQRLKDAQTARTYSGSWPDEITRYAFLSTEPPLRRAAVALILLATFAYILRGRHNGRGLLDFAPAVLVVGLILLIATPSKWPWHFGTLIGVGAVAVASETAHLRAKAARSKRWRAWPFLAVAAAAAVGYWVWRARAPWSPVDLRALSWDSGFSQVATLLPFFLLALATLTALLRGRGNHVYAVPWRVTSWTALALAVPPIVLTAAMLVADTAKTSSWTLARQNTQTIVGDPGCGLADDLLISEEDSARPLSTIGSGRLQTVPAWVPPAPVAGLPRFALGPVEGGPARSPWFALPTDRRVGLFVAGTPAPSASLWLDWGRQRRGHINQLGSDEFTELLRGFSANAPWSFFAAGDIPVPDPRATAVRITFLADTAPGSAVSVTAPVTYANQRLAREMNRAGSRSLVYPELLMYFPCTRLPTLSRGIVEVPRNIVLTDNGFSVLRQDVSSPFLGLLDLYELERMPISDTEFWPESVLVFAVDRRVPGAMHLPPTIETFTS